jgi:hypothetical protein
MLQFRKLPTSRMKVEWGRKGAKAGYMEWNFSFCCIKKKNADTFFVIGYLIFCFAARH